MPEKTKDNIKNIISILELISDFNLENIKSAIMNYANTLPNRGEVLHPIRYILSGLDKSPDPFTIAEVLGKNETISRLQKAI